MAQLLSRRGNALLGRAAPRVTSNRPTKLVVTCFQDSSKHTQEKIEKSVEKPVDQAMEVEAVRVEKAKITFQVPHHVEWGQDMCLVGEAEPLGNWDVSKCVPMAWHEGDVWTAEAELPQGASIEYKYVVRGAIEEPTPEVVEWQPCWNLALTADQQELTVRDHWDGDKHEVLAGTLPLPVLEATGVEEAVAEAVAEEEEPLSEAAPAATAAADFPISATLVATSESVVAAAQVGSPTPVVVDAPVDVEDLVADQMYGEPSSLPASSIHVPAAVVAAEELAAAESGGKFDAAAVPLRGLSGDGGKQPLVAAADEILAHNAVPSHGPRTPNYLAEKTPKSTPLKDLTRVATSELKQLCKQKGLPAKGQRRDLLARLQQHSA